METYPRSSNNSKKIILLVEDESILAMKEKTNLETNGYSVIIADSGETAIKCVEMNPDIDLILMDIDLGDGIDGTIASEYILKRQDIPIIFLSSHLESETVELTEKITSYGFVVKGSGFAALDASIKMAIKLFKTQQRLDKSEKLYRLLYENAGIGITYYKPDGVVIAYNALAAHYMGGEATDFVGRSIYDIFPRREAELLHNRIKETALSDHSSVYEDYIELPTGNRSFLRTFSPIIGPDDLLYGIQIISQDISMLKKTEENLRTHQLELQMQNEELSEKQKDLEALRQKYFSLYDMAPASFFMLDKNGKISQANLTAAQYLGIIRAELTKKSFPTFVHPEDQDIFYRFRGFFFDQENLTKHKNGVAQGCELRIKRSDGTVSRVFLHGTLAHDDEGNAFCHLVLTQNDATIK